MADDVFQAAVLMMAKIRLMIPGAHFRLHKYQHTMENLKEQGTPYRKADNHIKTTSLRQAGKRKAKLNPSIKGWSPKGWSTCSAARYLPHNILQQGQNYSPGDANQLETFASLRRSI